MKEKLKARLQSLKSEFEDGQKILADLEAKQDNLRQTLLRISGAIQVLEEMLAEVTAGDGFEADITDADGVRSLMPLETEPGT